MATVTPTSTSVFQKQVEVGVACHLSFMVLFKNTVTTYFYFSLAKTHVVLTAKEIGNAIF